MKTDFKFSNLLGTVYCQGNLLFSPDGTHLFSPVGNRVTVFNLVEYVSRCPTPAWCIACKLANTVAVTNHIPFPSPTERTLRVSVSRPRATSYSP